MLIAGVTADITDKVKAGELANSVAQQVGGKGGGRADMAQAGVHNQNFWPLRLHLYRLGLREGCKQDQIKIIKIPTARINPPLIT